MSRGIKYRNLSNKIKKNDIKTIRIVILHCRWWETGDDIYIYIECIYCV